MTDRLDRIEAMLDRLISNQLTHDDRISTLEAEVLNLAKKLSGYAFLLN